MNVFYISNFYYLFPLSLKKNVFSIWPTSCTCDITWKIRLFDFVLMIQYIYELFSFMGNVCRALFVPLSLFIYPLHCLFFKLPWNINGHQFRQYKQNEQTYILTTIFVFLSFISFHLATILWVLRRRNASDYSFWY
jgi:hypothetical protein